MRTHASESPSLEILGGDESYTLAPGGDTPNAASDAQRVTRDDLPIFVEHEVTRLLLAATPDFVHLHGAGVVLRGGAILAVGDSGSGKSSTAVAWSTGGERILGDDVVFIDRDIHVHPFRKPLKVVTGRAVAVGIRPEDTLYWQPGASEVWYDPAHGRGWGPAAPVRVIAFLNRRADGRTEIEPVSPARCAQLLLGQFMESGGRQPEWLDTVFELAEAVTALECSFSDSRDAARLLLEV